MTVNVLSCFARLEHELPIVDEPVSLGLLKAERASENIILLTIAKFQITAL
jgi:hypothetical protein